MKPGDLVRITDQTAPWAYVGMIGLCVGVRSDMTGYSSHERAKVVLLENGDTVYIFNDDAEVIDESR